MESLKKNNGLGESLDYYRKRAKQDGDWTYVHELRPPTLVDRDQYLVQLVRDRRIVHVGCATQGATLQQFRNNRLLFSLLEASSAAQLGVDPDLEGIKVLTDLVNPRIPPVASYLHEIEWKTWEQFNPQMILLPEIIEHVPDPGEILRHVARIARSFNCEIIITVPNALCLSGISACLRRMEFVHPDHVAYYSPRTLQTLLEKVEIHPLEIRPYYWSKPVRRNWMQKLRAIVTGNGPLLGRMLDGDQSTYINYFPDGWIASSKPY